MTTPQPLPDPFLNEKDLAGHAVALLDSLRLNLKPEDQNPRAASIALTQCNAMNDALQTGGIPSGVESELAIKVLSQMATAHRMPDGMNHVAIRAVLILANEILKQQAFIVADSQQRAMRAQTQQHNAGQSVQ